MKKLNGVSYDATMELVSEAFGGTSFDTEKWELKEIPGGIRLVQKELLEFYDFTCGVFALQQCKVQDDFFLIHYQSELGEPYTIAKVWLAHNQVAFQKYFNYQEAKYLSRYMLLLDSNTFDARLCLLVDKEFRINGILLYLICKLSNRGSLISDRLLCDSRKIKFIYGDDPQYPKYLKVEYELSSVLLTEYVQILLDPVTLQQVSPAYSTIRDKYFTLTESFTLHDLIAEDRNYVRTATDFLLQIYSADGRKTDEELIATIADH